MLLYICLVFSMKKLNCLFFNLVVFILVRYAYTGRRARQRMAEIIRELSSSIEVKVREFLNAKRSKLSGFW